MVLALVLLVVLVVVAAVGMFHPRADRIADDQPTVARGRF